MNQSALVSPPRPKRLSVVGYLDTLSGKHDRCTTLVPGCTNNVMQQVTQVKSDTVQVGPQENNDDDMSVREFESRHADQAVSDLPGVLSEVYAVQRMRSTEISRQKELLEQCRAKLAEVAERNLDIEAEVACVRNNIFMKEEWIKDTNKRIKQLDSEIMALLKARICHQLQVSLAEEETELEIRKMRAQCEKMLAHAHEVDEYEKMHSPIFRELQHVRDEVEKLRQQKATLEKDPEETASIVAGTVAMGIQSEVRTLQEKLRDTQIEAESLRQKIADERAKQSQIRQTMKVLEKRNCAQMTRVRRQTKEVTQRNSQRRAQITKLRANVDNVARKLQ